MGMKISWVTAILILGAVALMVAVFTKITWTTPEDRPKYREEPYVLKDGTPCTIIHGGSHSGKVGITCNYGD